MVEIEQALVNRWTKRGSFPRPGDLVLKGLSALVRIRVARFNVCFEFTEFLSLIEPPTNVRCRNACRASCRTDPARRHSSFSMAEFVSNLVRVTTYNKGRRVSRHDSLLVVVRWFAVCNTRL